MNACYTLNIAYLGVKTQWFVRNVVSNCPQRRSSVSPAASGKSRFGRNAGVETAKAPSINVGQAGAVSGSFGYTPTGRVMAKRHCFKTKREGPGVPSKTPGPAHLNPHGESPPRFLSKSFTTYGCPRTRRPLKRWRDTGRRSRCSSLSGRTAWKTWT